MTQSIPEKWKESKVSELHTRSFTRGPNLFKSTKLSVRMALGFGFIILITTILSATNWCLLNRIEHKVGIDQVNTAIAQMDKDRPNQLPVTLPGKPARRLHHSPMTRT